MLGSLTPRRTSGKKLDVVGVFRKSLFDIFLTGKVT